MFFQARVRAGHASKPYIIFANAWLTHIPKVSFRRSCWTSFTRNTRTILAQGVAVPKEPRLITLRTCSRTFVTTKPICRTNDLPPRPTVDEDEFTKRSLKGSGPGGQKINKTNSAIQLRHLPTGIVVKCQATRSRPQNEKIARRILAEKIELLQKGDQSRVALKAERASRKKRSAEKKSRRKYRKLAEEQQASTAAVGEEMEEEVGIGSAIGLDRHAVSKGHEDRALKQVDRERNVARQAIATKGKTSLDDVDIVIESLEDDSEKQVDDAGEQKKEGSLYSR